MRVLFVACDPVDACRLRCAAEERAIRRALRGTGVQLDTLPAATVEDLHEALISGVHYDIVHFSGHSDIAGRLGAVVRQKVCGQYGADAMQHLLKPHVQRRLESEVWRLVETICSYFDEGDQGNAGDQAGPSMRSSQDEEEEKGEKEKQDAWERTGAALAGMTLSRQRRPKSFEAISPSSPKAPPPPPAARPRLAATATAPAVAAGVADSRVALASRSLSPKRPQRFGLRSSGSGTLPRFVLTVPGSARQLMRIDVSLKEAMEAGVGALVFERHLSRRQPPLPQAASSSAPASAAAAAATTMTSTIAVSSSAVGTCPHPVHPRALADLLSAAGTRRRPPQCVVLNACGSAIQGSLIWRQGAVRTVLCSRTRISDAEAVSFSEGFYGALGRGHRVEDAVAEGRSRVLLTADVAVAAARFKRPEQGMMMLQRTVRCNQQHVTSAASSGAAVTTAAGGAAPPTVKPFASASMAAIDSTSFDDGCSTAPRGATATTAAAGANGGGGPAGGNPGSTAGPSVEYLVQEGMRMLRARDAEIERLRHALAEATRENKSAADGRARQLHRSRRRASRKKNQQESSGDAAAGQSQRKPRQHQHQKQQQGHRQQPPGSAGKQRRPRRRKSIPQDSASGSSDTDGRSSGLHGKDIIAASVPPSPPRRRPPSGGAAATL